MVLTSKEANVNFDDYIIDAALISEISIDCKIKSSGNLRPNAALYWENIPIEDNIAEFGITSEQSKNLHPGRYFVEVALYTKINNNAAKTQTLNIIEILPTYTR